MVGLLLLLAHHFLLPAVNRTRMLFFPDYFALYHGTWLKEETIEFYFVKLLK